MGILAIAFTNQGVVVADGAVAAAQAANWAISGEAVTVVVRTADNAAPAVEYIWNLADLGEIAQHISNSDINALIKEAFATTLGTIAAAASIGSGPALALAADKMMSEAFKNAYDSAQNWSRALDWSPFFDVIDDIRDWWRENTQEDPNQNRESIPIDRWIDEGLIDPHTLLPRVTPDVNRNWNTAITPPRRDPLAIDLDGDGIETVGTGTNPVLFDHNADGIRTGTGWLRGDDAWLTLDRNGNGSIDSGRELFGVDTEITVTEPVNGQTATVTRNARNGFEALASLDSNGDKVFNAQDAAFSQVRLWQDLNQDGISQANELTSLAQQGITGISLLSNGATTNLGNGNTVTGQATVTRSNGSTTQAGSVDLAAGNLDLASNPFYREFSDDIPLTEAALALPEMGGSGVLRDLREAMSLGTPQAEALVAAVQAYAHAGSREEQLARLDALLWAWADTAGDDHSTGRHRAGQVEQLGLGSTTELDLSAFEQNFDAALDARNVDWRSVTGTIKPAGTKVNISEQRISPPLRLTRVDIAGLYGIRCIIAA